MMKNIASISPVISIISTDGARFVIPEQAAEYSVLLKSALERWTLEYLSQPSTAINNDDDDERDSYEETTEPLRSSSISGQSDMDSSSSYTSSSSMDDDSFVNRGLLPRCQTIAPPPAPLKDISSKDETKPHMSLVVDSMASNNSNRASKKCDSDREAANAGYNTISGSTHEPFTPPSSTTYDERGCGPYFVALGKKTRKMHEPTGDSSATCENLPSYFSAPRGTVCSTAQARLKGGETGIEGGCNAGDSSGTGLGKDHSPTVVVIEESHVDPQDAETWFDVAPTEVPGSSLVDTLNERREAIEDSPKDVQKVLYNCPSPALNSTNLSNSFDNRSSPQGEWKSPTSVHQRTPVMLEDDDKVIIMGSNGQQKTLHSLGRLSTSPCAGSIEKTCHGICDNDYEIAVKNIYVDVNSENNDMGSNIHETNERQPSICADVDSKSAPLTTTSDAAVFPFGSKNNADTHDDTVYDLNDISNRARITAGEILIDLRPFPLNEEKLANSTSALSGSSPASTNASSNKRSASQAATQSADRMACKGEVSDGMTPHYNGNGGTASSKKNAFHTPKVYSKALQLCVDYLLHFVQAAQDLEAYAHEDVPTVLPMPLTAPLCSLLSPWERNFLYVNILGYDGSTMKTMIMIDTILPDGIDYHFPGMVLADKSVRDALVMRPPRAEGMRTLMQVRKAAQELRIDTLHELCLAWMADFMIRASYGTSNNFEAAHLIQQCFGIQNEWTRKEMDCLRIENDWPANEEEC
ncbi:unnamed protein product [Phytomonas sp. EM1]|nr:unnamed protein product [Phytomonas sp. EM1]|eukprot:CCW64596.1 unnamed protein product [Phytomonas sp. isolate EM1]